MPPSKMAAKKKPVQRSMVDIDDFADESCNPPVSLAPADRACAPADALQALSDAALERLAGATVFARGRAYARDDRCVPLREGDAAGEWLVHGGEDYRVRLELGPRGLDGDCSCPYAEEGAVCKHMVAAALAWRRRLGGSAARADASAPDPLHAFLQGRPAVELAARLVTWAARDRTLSLELKAWQAQHALAADPAAWKQAVDEALRKTRGFYDPAASRDYARRGELLLPLLQDLVRRDPPAAREACVLALRRTFRVGEQADDSAGRIGDLMRAVHAVLLAALRADPPVGAAAQRWLRTWLNLQERDPWGLWDDEGMVVAAGPQVRAHYSARVARDWEEWLAHRRTAATPEAEWDERRWRVRSRYLADRRHHGDSDAVLAAIRADLRGAHEVVELAGELEALVRPREALQALELGARTFPGDRRIEDALLSAYERDGCHAECLVIRRAQLERQPDVAHYAAVLQAATAAGRDPEAYRSDLYRWAEEAERVDALAVRQVWRRRDPAAADVTVRLRWLLHDGRSQEALALARQDGHLVGEDALRALAVALRTSDRQAADAVFRQLIEARMQRARTPYREELDLAGEWLAGLPAEQVAERLAWLRASYRAKRNFVAGLERLAPR